MRKLIYPFFPKETSIDKMTINLVENMWADGLAYKTKRTNDVLQKATLEKNRSLLRKITYFGYWKNIIAIDYQKAEMKIPINQGIQAVSRRKKKFLDKDKVVFCWRQSKKNIEQIRNQASWENCI